MDGKGEEKVAADPADTNAVSKGSESFYTQLFLFSGP